MADNGESGIVSPHFLSVSPPSLRGGKMLGRRVDLPPIFLNKGLFNTAATGPGNVDEEQFPTMIDHRGGSGAAFHAPPSDACPVVDHLAAVRGIFYTASSILALCPEPSSGFLRFALLCG